MDFKDLLQNAIYISSDGSMLKKAQCSLCKKPAGIKDNFCKRFIYVQQIQARMNIKKKLLTGSHIKESKGLFTVFEDVFEMKNITMPNSMHLNHLLNARNFLGFIAKAGNKLVDDPTTYIVGQYYSKKAVSLYLWTVNFKAITGEGIGKKLIGCLFNY